MNKGEIVDIISEKNNLSKRKTNDVIDSLLGLIVETVSSGGKVKFVNFGTFGARLRKAKKGVNPQAPNEKIDIPERIVPTFSAGKRFVKAAKIKDPTTD